MDPSLSSPQKKTTGDGLPLTRAQLNRPLTTLTNTKAQKTVPGVFNVTSAMKSGHVETGTIVRDKKSNRSLLEVFSLVLQEWKEGLTRKTTSVSAPPPSSAPIPPSTSDAAIEPTRLEVPKQDESILQKTIRDTTASTRIPRIRTYALDRAQLMGTAHPVRQTTSIQPPPIEKKFHVERAPTQPLIPEAHIDTPVSQPPKTPDVAMPSKPLAPLAPVSQVTQSVPSRRRITHPDGVEKISFPTIGLTTQPHGPSTPTVPKRPLTSNTDPVVPAPGDQNVSHNNASPYPSQQLPEKERGTSPVFHTEGVSVSTEVTPRVVESTAHIENVKPVLTVATPTVTQRRTPPSSASPVDQPRTQRPSPAISETESSRKTLITVLIPLVCVLLLLGIIYFVYMTRTQSSENQPEMSPIVNPVTTFPKPPTGTTRANTSEPLIADVPFATLTQTFHTQRIAQTAPLFTPYLVTQRDEGYTILTTQDFFGLLSHPLTPATLRAFSEEFTWGAIISENESFPFIEFTINDFDRVFASLLTHEIDFAESVSPLISPIPFETHNARFTDAIRANTSIRVLTNAEGTEHMVYGFIGKRTLIITTSKQAFAVIAERYRDNI